MTLGIDVYRYQDVRDWQAVKNAGVAWVYVKLTDGDGLAPVHGDAQVRGAQAVKLPVGGYHFAQPGDPARQADVLLGEIRRLGAGDLPPMLDLEDNPPGSGRPNIPGSQKTAWAHGFLRHVAAAKYRPCVYMSSADAKTLRPDLWDIRDLVVWIASYGPNDGTRHSIAGYAGRVDIHQYTSVGRLPGIVGAVDLNQATIPLTQQEDDMRADEPVISPQTGKSIGPYTDVVFYTNFFVNMIPALAQAVAGVSAKVDTVAAAVAQDAGNDLTIEQVNAAAAKAITETPAPPVHVTVDQGLITAGLTAAVEHMSDEALARFAGAAADEQDRRARQRLAAETPKETS